jgi:hypothetical protein
MNARLLVVALEREPDIVLLRKRTRRVATWRAPGEFLRGGTNSSNPSPSSAESANYQFRGRQARKGGQSKSAVPVQPAGLEQLAILDVVSTMRCSSIVPANTCKRMAIASSRRNIR